MFTNITGKSLFHYGLLLLAVGVSWLLLSGAKKKPKTDYFPVEDVHAGLKGYGLSVFSGRDPEKFDVEVISVIHQFLPKQDVILVRCNHPVINHTGVIAGMSGSPVYFNGKLAGAVAYAWRFSKDPIAGVTPAGNMLEYFKIPEVPKKGYSKKVLSSKLFAPMKAQHAASAPVPAGKSKGFWQYFTPGASNELSPLITPLTGSMLQGLAAVNLIDQEMSNFFLAPAQASSFPQKAAAWKKVKGKKNKNKEKKASFRPGDPVAVQMVRGDIDLSGSGTVTAVKGNKVLAFGHPMFNFGQIEIPVTTAFVHHCLASLSFSFKMTEPEQEAGALVLDRQAAVMVDTDRKAHVIPLKIHLEDKNRNLEETWNMEVIHHRMLTSSLVRVAITSAVDKFAPDIEEAVIEAGYAIDIHNHKSLELKDKVFQSKGTLSLLYSSKLSASLEALISSDFEKVRIDGIEADISINYTYGKAYISGAYLSAEEAKEGEIVDLYVFVKPHRGSEQIYSTSFKVPQGMEGKSLSVTIQSGKDAFPETIMPQDIDDVIENLAKSYPPDSIVVTVQLPGQSLAIGGKIIKNLPPSALDTLRPKAAFLGEKPEAVVERKFIYPGMLMDGKVKLSLQVKGQDKK